MSYARFKREALDESLKPNVRANKLRSAMGQYSWLTRTSFSSVWVDLARRHGFHRDGHVPPRLVSAVMNDLDAARTSFLAALSRYAAFRKLQKASGVRRADPTLKAALSACVSLGRPRE